MKGKLCVRRGLRAIFTKLKRPSSIEQTLPTRAPYNPLRLLKNAQGAIEIRNIPFAFTCKTERKKKINNHSHPLFTETSITKEISIDHRSRNSLALFGRALVVRRWILARFLSCIEYKENSRRAMLPASIT